MVKSVFTVISILKTIIFKIWCKKVLQSFDYKGETRNQVLGGGKKGESKISEISGETKAFNTVPSNPLLAFVLS